MRSTRLYFQGTELIGIEYQELSSAPLRYCVRGKTGGAFSGAGSFQWTTAVRALCVMLLSAVENPHGVHLTGFAGSLAASLDYALTKQPVWLTDMFGTDSHGTCNARRFILRTNSERKRPGPVSLRINPAYLPPESITVVSNGELLDDVEVIRGLRDRLLNEGVSGRLAVAA